MKIFKFGERVIYTDTSSNEKLNGVVIDVDTTKPFCEVALFNGRLKRVHTDFLNAAGGGLDWRDTRFDTPPEEGTPVLVSDGINIIQTTFFRLGRLRQRQLSIFCLPELTLK